MNIKKLKQAWYPIYRSQELKQSPVAVSLFGQNLVLVRYTTNNNDKQKNNNQSCDKQSSDKKGCEERTSQVRCFADRCPHRLVPLSMGSMADQRLRCAYHGWAFDCDGRLTDVPGLQGDCPNIHLTTYPCRDEAGWIWVCLNEDVPFVLPEVCGERNGFDRLTAYKRFSADFIHAIENFLDPIHTPFIHRGLIRSAGRQHLRYRQQHDERSFVTHYQLMNKQNGLINKLFDPGVNINIATFDFPSLASIAYCQDDKVLFQVSLFFVPLAKGEVAISANVHIAKSRVAGWIKFALMRPLVELVFYQDKKMLAKQWQSGQQALTQRTDNKNMAYHSTHADLVIDHLLYLLAGKAEGVDKQGEMILQLAD